MSKPLDPRVDLGTRLRMADLQRTATATFAIADRLQDEAPEVQTLAMTCAFLVMAKRLSLRPNDLFSLADNIMETAEGTRPEFKGLAAYFKEELGS